MLIYVFRLSAVLSGRDILSALRSGHCVVPPIHTPSPEPAISPLEAGGGGGYTVYTLETLVQGGGGRAGLFIPQHGLTCGLPALCKVSRGIEKVWGGGGDLNCCTP